MKNEMTNVTRALASVYGKKVDHISCASGLVIITDEIMKFSAATYPKVHHDPYMMAELAAAPYELCGIEGTTLPFDISLEAEVLGAELDWNKADRPPIKKHTCLEPDELVIPEKIEEKGRIPTVLKAIELLKQKYGEDLAVLPTSICPFTISGHMASVDELFCWILSNPEKVHTLMDKITEFVIEYQKLMEANGADILFIPDPTSSGDLISGEMYNTFVKPYIKKIAKSTKIPKILHICGDTSPMLDSIRETGIECFSFDKKVSVAYAYKKMQNKMTLYGNLDVIDLLPRKSPDDVYKAAQECIYQGVNIVGTACDVPPTTPLENIKAFVNACKETKVPTKEEIRLQLKI